MKHPSKTTKNNGGASRKAQPADTMEAVTAAVRRENPEITLPDGTKMRFRDLDLHDTDQFHAYYDYMEPRWAEAEEAAKSGAATKPEGKPASTAPQPQLVSAPEPNAPQPLAPEAEIRRSIDRLTAKRDKLKAEMTRGLTQQVWSAVVEVDDELSDLTTRLKSVEAAKANAKRVFLKSSTGGTPEMFERLWPSLYEDMLRDSMRQATAGPGRRHSMYNVW